MNILDLIRVKKSGATGKIIMLMGYPATELYADMYPGAEAGYEYITMWDENEKRPELRALNRYNIEDVQAIQLAQQNNIVENQDNTQQTNGDADTK